MTAGPDACSNGQTLAVERDFAPESVASSPCPPGKMHDSEREKLPESTEEAEVDGNLPASTQAFLQRLSEVGMTVDYPYLHRLGKDEKETEEKDQRRREGEHLAEKSTAGVSTNSSESCTSSIRSNSRSRSRQRRTKINFQGGAAESTSLLSFHPLTPTTAFRICVCLARLTWQLASIQLMLFALFLSALMEPGMYRDSVVLLLILGLSHQAMFDFQFRWCWLGLGLPPDAVHPGVYFAPTEFNKALRDRLPMLQNATQAGDTPFCRDGDARTMLPFLLFGPPRMTYIRRWIKVAEAYGPSPGFYPSDGPGQEEEEGEEEGEAVALDWAFPPGGYNAAKGVVLILHGLNGGSGEPYVLDTVHEALDRGMTACVMVARGLMRTPVVGHALFHGARVSDVGTAAQAISDALAEGQSLALVGFSMGAIVAANYMCKAGDKCPVTCAVAIGGSFDTRTNINFTHSAKNWQPLLTYELKKSFIVPNLSLLHSRGLDLATVERANTVTDFDRTMLVPYNGYESVEDYYCDMSAGCGGKLSLLRRPLLAVHAVDDPIMTSDSYPVKETHSCEDIMYLITPYGGHVGWPRGWAPSTHRWHFMRCAAIDYFEAVIEVQQLQQEGKPTIAKPVN